MSGRDNPEISDVVVSFDARTLSRRAVLRDDAAAALTRAWPRRIVRRLVADVDGVLDPGAVDRELVAAHRELQRLNEEFQQGARLRAVLRPLVALAQAQGLARPRIVDVGCGIGFAVRWLAAYGGLDAELVGCDFNPALLGEAQAAAAADGLDCHFVRDDAFSPRVGADVFTSCGVMHHFRDEGLAQFFAGQARGLAFVHYDIAPSPLAPIGAALFHFARMRVPLARHDGIRSALRAHDDTALLTAARGALPDFVIGVYDGPRSRLSLTKVLRPVVGVRRSLAESFRRGLGRRARLWRC